MAMAPVSTVAHLAREVVSLFSTGDLERLESLIAPDYVDHQGLRGTTVHGPAGFRTVVESARGALADLEVSIEDLVASGQTACLRIRWSGIRGDGRRVDRETIDMLRFEHHLMVEHWGAESSSKLA